jgi:2-polyprenyl-6-methoxyphenol hydroxylase-like FAD-dependent oxidoreductase
VLSALFAHVQTRDQIEKAFKAYDLERRARCQMVVRTASEMLRRCTFGLPGTTNANIVQRVDGVMNSVVGRDIADQNEHAVKLFLEA